MASVEILVWAYNYLAKVHVVFNMNESTDYKEPDIC